MKKIMTPTAQLSLYREIAIDGFAGGGGTSTGYELATGEPIDIAINHDPAAVRMHEANHQFTQHFCEDIWQVDPHEAVAGRPVGMAWFSPDCKHFSRAKGGKPVEKKIRGLPWVAVKWAAVARPRVLIIENVVEFMDWGPLVAKRDPQTGRCLKVTGQDKNGKKLITVARKGERVPVQKQLLCADKSRAGETFHKWVRALNQLGYYGEFRKLLACDYGVPSSRERFFGIFRCDGRPIVWPEPTHGKPESREVKEGRLLPYRTAGEIIDWSLPMYSIFATKAEIKEQHGVSVKRPLADATLRRIAKGIDKFVLKSPDPYIVVVNHRGENFRGQSIHESLNTVTAKNGYSVVAPTLTQYHMEQGAEVRGQPMNKPLMTIDTNNRYGLTTAHLTKFQQNSIGQDCREPIDTIMAGATRFGTVGATLVQMGYGEAPGQSPRVPGLQKPLGTIVAKEKHGLVAANIIKLRGTNTGQPLDSALQTITAQGNHFALSGAFITKYYGTGGDHSLEEPLHTITSKDHLGMVTAVLVRADNTNQLQGWPTIRNFLNKYGGYDLQADEVLLLCINGMFFYLSDITFRMLAPRELYNAQSFPPDYRIDLDGEGNKYSKKEQVARCGNSVPPLLAEAIIRANFPEKCAPKITTMAQLNDMIAI